MVHVASATALYILNNKRQRLTEIEARYGMRACFAHDESLLPAQTRIDKLRAALPQDLPTLSSPEAQVMPDDDAGEIDVGVEDDDVEMGQTRVEAGASAGETIAGDFTADADHVPGETAAEGEQRRRRRRRRRRGGGKREDGLHLDTAAPMPAGTEQPDIFDQEASPDAPDLVPVGSNAIELDRAPATASLSTDASLPMETLFVTDSEPAESAPEAAVSPTASAETGLEPELEQAKAKRGRRGGRRRRKPGEDAETSVVQAVPIETPAPAYVGPTPADPFAMSGLDIFDAIEQAEMGFSAIGETSPSIVERELELEPVPAEHPASLEAVVPQAPAADVSPVPSETVDRIEPAAPVEPEPALAVAETVIQPVLVGVAETEPTERKKGWWRR